MPTSIILSPAALTNDTVRFLATVRDFNGVLTDPGTPQWTVYQGNPPFVFAGPFSAVRDAVGQYHLDYLIPASAAPLSAYFIEFTGSIAGEQSTQRARFTVAFA